MSDAFGFAYKDKDGKIDVATVQDSEIGVMVNFLVVRYKIALKNGDQDWYVKSMFEAMKEGGDVVKVQISEVKE